LNGYFLCIFMTAILDTYTAKQVKKEFTIHTDLDRNFWPTDDALLPAVRAALLKIAKKFMETLDIHLPVKDITFTGSLANYNYSDKSDVDLHIVVDYSKLGSDRKLVEEYLALKKSHWNEIHRTLNVFGHPVEVYVEDEATPHISTGLYSIANNKWIKQPKHSQPKYDPQDVATKANYFKSLYKVLLKQFRLGKYEAVAHRLDAARVELRDMRKSGLATGGEYSTENLAFKVLRRSGLIQKIIDLRNVAIDKQESV